MGRIHLVENEVIDRQSFTVTIVRRFYLAMIFATIGGMLLHNILIWFRKAQRKRRAAGRTVVRMNVNQRVQHLLLLSSFIVLVLTGFALAYPESPFAWLFGSSETPRRLIHRIAALVMMGVGLYHIGYMVGTREGRQGLKDFWFNFKDARDVVDVMKYYLGLSKKHPRMGRFTYGEKAEYWAVVWGTVVMGITGLMIWYNVISTNWMPWWWIDVATTIHFYEAVLATLAIIVWHLYNVIFDPDAYPLNWAWFDGKMDEEQFEHEHGLEYDKMRRERLEGHIISSDRE
jgi:cytochrome b subunit of formate dehydrogenase